MCVQIWERGRTREYPRAGQDCVPIAGLFPLRGMTANPPAGLVVIMRQERAHAGLGSDTHVVELLLVVFQRSLQKQVYLHAVITAAAPHFELPHGPVANPQRGGDRQQPDQTAFHDQSHGDAPSSTVSGIWLRSDPGSRWGTGFPDTTQQ